jgi:positive regulator of sigma E activity
MIHVLAILGLGAACAGWAALRLRSAKRQADCGKCELEATCATERLIRS